jgi:DNA-binding NarL/FixJ family response regulator
MTDAAPLQAAPDAEPVSGGPSRDGALRLVVVDADDRTRESVVGLLGIRERFRVVGSAGHLGAAIRLVEELHPDVVIMDPRLPEVSGGVALIRAIRGIDPGVRILAVGWSPDLEHDTLEAGADGFVRKTFRPAELAEAITRCMEAGAGHTATGIIL